MSPDRNRKIGIISNYVPREIVEVFGVPFRILGDLNPVEHTALPTFACSFVRDLIMSFNCGSLDYLEGIILPQTCDSLYAACDLLERHGKFVHRFVQVNSSVPEARQFALEEQSRLIEFLEKQLCVPFSEEALSGVIRSANRVRRRLREVASASHFSRVTFLELVLRVLQSRFADVEEEVRAYQPASAVEARRRVMVVGPIVDDWQLLEYIESVPGTKIVADNITNGLRFIDGDIREEGNPLDALADYYLGKLHSPTFGESSRYADSIRRVASESGANCVILLNQRGCEPHSYLIPAVAGLCAEMGLGFLPINLEHSSRNEVAIRLRLQSFLETL